MSVVTETQRVRVGRNSWQTSLTGEIINLEDNLDRLYHIVGLKSHRIVQLDEADQLININNNNDKGNTKETSKYQDIIEGHLEKVKQAAVNICSLINSVTQFDLPIPVYVLLRLATRVASLRWIDFDKKIGGALAKRHVYSKSPELISISLMMYKWISHPLGTNVISFQPFINQNLVNILEWTRMSGLAKHNEAQYLGLRCQIFNLISDAIERLSLNINLEPKQLQTLIHIELIDSLHEHCITLRRAELNGITNGEEEEEGEEDQLTIVKDKYLAEALICLERLFLVYGDYLDAKLDHLLKTYVIQTCMKIYRDFEKNVIGLANRRQLLRLLETISSQPYATSTTELAWHLFELADMMETDADIKMVARRSLKVGLAHRPVLVSHHDVYNCHIRTMTSASGDEGEGEQQPPQPPQQEPPHPPPQQEPPQQEPPQPPPQQEPEQNQVQVEESGQDGQQVKDGQHQGDEDKPEDDPEVQSCMNLFVSKPAGTRMNS